MDNLMTKRGLNELKYTEEDKVRKFEEEFKDLRNLADSYAELKIPHMNQP